jgi:hypothetical protein
MGISAKSQEDQERCKQKFANIVTAAKVANKAFRTFYAFPSDIRDRIYELVLAIPTTQEPVNIRLGEQEFFRPRATSPLCLNLSQICQQVNDELSISLFSKIFQFDNLDTLLAFLATSRNARRFLRHVDVSLVSGPQELSTYALNALSELNLHTLTIRCHAVQGAEEDWTKSFKLRLLVKTRGVKKVTLGIIDEDWRSRIGSLSASDPLAHKLVTLLQRPAITPRRDPNRLPLLPEWPRLGFSGCMPESLDAATKSMTDFRRLKKLRVIDYAMVDPLCEQHTGIPWCICIESTTLSPFPPSKLADMPS